MFRCSVCSVLIFSHSCIRSFSSKNKSALSSFISVQLFDCSSVGPSHQGTPSHLLLLLLVLPHLLSLLSHPFPLIVCFFFFVSRAPLHIDQEHAHLRTLSHLCNRWSPSQSLLPLPSLLIRIPSTKSPQHQPLNQLVII